MTRSGSGGVPMEPGVVFEQTRALGADLRLLSDRFAREFEQRPDLPAGGVDAVVLVGNGDSHHAALTAQLAFEQVANVPCVPMSAYRFEGYAADAPVAEPGRVPVLAVSASGRSPAVVRSAVSAAERGFPVLAFTGDPHSPLAAAASATVCTTVPDLRPSPGVRTYQASVCALLMCACRMGEIAGRGRAREVRDALCTLPEAVERTAGEALEKCEQLAAQLAGAAVVLIAGSGPSEGTAKFCAAKLVEAAGMFATGQDLDEWVHVERFATPRDMPVVVLSPSGRSEDKAAAVAERAASLGRRVIAVVPPCDDGASRHAEVVLPISGDPPEEISGLLYPVFAAPLGGFLALGSGRRPFEAGR